MKGGHLFGKLSGTIGKSIGIKSLSFLVNERERNHQIHPPKIEMERHDAPDHQQGDIEYQQPSLLWLAWGSGVTQLRVQGLRKVGMLKDSLVTSLDWRIPSCTMKNGGTIRF